MIPKDYQKRALATVREFLEQMGELREKAARVRESDPDLTVDWVRSTWEKVSPRAFQSRKNCLGEPLPSFCLKIPTGGGKTFLATKVVDLVNTHYRKKRNGFVLWIVPTTQIYNQTLRALRDRDHPYRQVIDIASAGRTLILEKTNPFSPLDVQDNLCVLLLMLPSANRQTKDQLRMFRDSGGFDRFFAADEDVRGHTELLERIPNLDAFGEENVSWGRQVKSSLGVCAVGRFSTRRITRDGDRSASVTGERAFWTTRRRWVRHGCLNRPSFGLICGRYPCHPAA